MAPRPGLFRQGSSGGFSMALPSAKHLDAAKENTDAHKPEDQCATLALRGTASENEVTDVVPVTCHLPRTEAVPPTPPLSGPEANAHPSGPDVQHARRAPAGHRGQAERGGAVVVGSVDRLLRRHRPGHCS